MSTVVGHTVGQSTSTPSPTAAPTSTPTLNPCDPVHACQADAVCGRCLNATQPYAQPDQATRLEDDEAGFIVSSFTMSKIATMEREYFNTLIHTSECINNSMFSAAMNAIIFNAQDFFDQGAGCDLPFGICQVNTFECFNAGPPCTTCLETIFGATDADAALYSAACNETRMLNLTGHVMGEYTFPLGVDFSVRNEWEYDMAISCVAFPACSVLKNGRYCSGSCASALARLRAGDVSGAVQLCSESNAACYQLDQIVKACLGHTDLTYAYFAARCRSIPICDACFSEMGNLTMGPVVIAQGLYRSGGGCDPFPWPADHVLENLVYQSPYSIVSPCSMSAYRCAYNSGSCVACVANLIDADPLPADIPPSICRILLDDYAVPSTCAPCPDSLSRINSIVVATVVVGAFSVVLCLMVVVLIVAYSKDKLSLRNRILFNLMIANAVYSSANAIPISLYSTDIGSCGELVMSFSAIQFGRAWWFGGKYAIVFLEMLILGWSTVALTLGERSLPWRWEFALHATCAVGGLAAFVGFYVSVGRIERHGYNAATQTAEHSNSYTHLNADDDANDVNPAAAASTTWTAAHSEYNRVLQTMLQVWVGFLCLSIVMWIYLRRLFVRLLASWQVRLSEAETAWDRDLWAPHQQGERATKLRLLTISKDAYEELARPLEPFVVVFILFGIPATVMATDYCADNSSSDTNAAQQTYSNNAIEYGDCNAVCELVLAFRSMTTVAVYFVRREHRTELADVHTMWKRLKERVGGWFRPSLRHTSGVRFRGMMLEEVQMITSSDEYDDCAGLASDSEVVAASVPYRPFAETDT